MWSGSNEAKPSKNHTKIQLFMKIAIYTHASQDNVAQLLAPIQNLDIEWEINPESINCDHNIVVSLGGDGTLLDAVRHVVGAENNPPILGVNSGRLGFLTKIKLDEWSGIIGKLLNKDYHIEKRSMLEISTPSTTNKRWALNEFTTQRSEVSLIEIEVKVNDVEVAKFWGDGIIVATPTGSTAYSMSVGGAILSPESQTIIISPVAPHNLSLRPLVVADSSKIEICARSRGENGITTTVDNLQSNTKQCDCSFTITKSAKSLVFIDLNGEPNSAQFYKTLRQKLNWGVDLRN